MKTLSEIIITLQQISGRIQKLRVFAFIMPGQ